MTNQNSQEFQTDHIKGTVTRHPGCMAHFDVTIDSQLTDKLHKQAIKAVKKEVSIPGFRKGKVPDNVVQHNFGTNIEKEFRDRVTQKAFEESLKETKCHPFGKHAVKRTELKKCTASDGAHFIFDLETEPQVPTIGPESIQTEPVASREITQEQKDLAYKQLQISFAEWEDVADRTVEDGDFVEVDIDVVEHPAHNVCTNKRLHVDTKELPQWLYKTLVGLAIDESKQTKTQTNPDDPKHVFVQDKDAPAKECLVVLKKIKKATFPIEDEAFAKKFGVETIDELKNALEKKLKDEEAAYASELSRYNLRRELLEKYPIDLPRSLIDAEVRSKLAFGKQGTDLSKGSLPSDQKEAELKLQIEAETRGFFAWLHLLRQFTKTANVAATQQELEETFYHQMQLPREHRLIYPGLSQEDVRNRLFMLILMKKCEEYLLSQRTQEMQQDASAEKNNA